MKKAPTSHNGGLVRYFIFVAGGGRAGAGTAWISIGTAIGGAGRIPWALAMPPSTDVLAAVRGRRFAAFISGKTIATNTSSRKSSRYY